MAVCTAAVRIRAGRSRVQNCKSGRVKCHPVAGKSSPDCRWWVGTAATVGSFGHEQEEVRHGVSEKAVHHIAHPVRRALQNDLPEVSAIHVPHESLGNEYSGNPHHKDSDVQHPEIRFRCYPPPHDSADVNPKAKNQSSGRNQNEEPQEGSCPARNRWACSCPSHVTLNRSPSLQEGLDVRLQQERPGRIAWVVVGWHRFALEVADELIGLVLCRNLSNTYVPEWIDPATFSMQYPSCAE